jgi:hypothetical protein
MKLPKSPKLLKAPKLPETTMDLVVLLITGMVASLVFAIVVMGYQERKIPPEFEKVALFLGGITGGAIAANRLSS